MESTRAIHAVIFHHPSTILISSSLNPYIIPFRGQLINATIKRPVRRRLDLTFQHFLLLRRATSSPKFRILEFALTGCFARGGVRRTVGALALVQFEHAFHQLIVPRFVGRFLECYKVLHILIVHRRQHFRELAFFITVTQVWQVRLPISDGKNRNGF